MTVLVVAEIIRGRLAKDITARAIAAVASLGDVVVLCAGEGARPAAEDAAGISGVSKVLSVEDPVVGKRLAEPMAKLIVDLSGDYTHIVAPATVDAKNILPRVAALLDVMVLTDVTRIMGPDAFERPIYAGNAFQEVRSRDRIKVVSVRTTGFQPAPDGGSAPVESLDIVSANEKSEWQNDQFAASDRPELASANVVVSGGRGLGSKEAFEIVEALADKLGAAVGASRAAVDAGYAPNDWQVGQTGKVVAPKLYVAVGISGAIQHLAGMKDSETIVAINKDPEAPIFQIADIGLVADLFEAVPELTQAL